MKQIRQTAVWMCLFLVFLGIRGISAETSESAGQEDSVTAFLLEQTTDFRQEREAVFPRYITVQGVDIGGMTLKEVRSWIDSYTDERLRRHVTLMVLGESYEYEMTGFGMSHSNPELIDELEGYLLSGNFVRQYTQQKDIQANPVSDTIDFEIDRELVAQTVNDYVAHYACDASNAMVVKGDGGFQVVEGVIGRSFEAEAIISDLTARLTDYSQTETLVYDFPHADTMPQYMSDSFNFAFSILGEYTTSNLGEESRRNNIIRSAATINGKVVYPGETFTALTWYGAVTEENGYQIAPTYQDGQQVPGVGGGICQTTTTLYDALLYAEMGIGYRSPHSMLVAYTPPSMDAMVDYESGSDFIAFNNSEYPIYFESYVSGDSLTVRVWGNETRPANRQFRYEHQIIEMEFPDPLYAVETINDEKCLVGAYSVAEKVYEEVAPHPYLVSKLIKTVTVDGRDVEQSVVNPEHQISSTDGYDDYKQMQGVFYHASDCVVNNVLINDDSVWLKKRVHHDIRFLNGQPWNAATYAENAG